MRRFGETVDTTQARIRVREEGIARLNVLTTWIAVGALAALGAFAVIAARTIPGSASSSQSPSAPASSANASTWTGTSYHHHHDGNFGPSSVSASSGPPMVVTGGSR